MLGRIITLAAAAAALAAAHAASTFSVSNTLGDHMVLQRDSASTMVWGFAASGVVVTTNFNGQALKSTAGPDGVWRQPLPSTPAGGPYTITMTSSDGGSASLADVLMGDVYVCGGQSNMQFTVDCGLNATAEAAAAANYPNIRVFTVGQGTTSNVSLTNLASITQPWAVASPASIGAGNWSQFSAVCWFFGRNLYDSLGGSTPIGLISDNWGGTVIQAWSSPDALAKCPQPLKGEDEAEVVKVDSTMDEAVAASAPNPNLPSVLWNAMIAPYTTGPMAVKGFTWFQGEANAGQAAFYACAFPAMIADWRAKLGLPASAAGGSGWFGFVQLEPWITGGGYTLAQFRDAQMNATGLPGVGFATAVDIGDPLSPFGSVHPRHKQIVGARLAAAALSEVYGQATVPYQHPQYQSSTGSTSGTSLTVTVSFQPGTVPSGVSINANGEWALCPTSLGVPANLCAYPTIYTSSGPAAGYNASVTLTSDGKGVVFSATAATPGEVITASSYGYGTWPVLNIFSSACWAAPAVADPVCFPALTWMRNVTAAWVE